MPTDISEKGPEMLIMRHMTGTDALKDAISKDMDRLEKALRPHLKQLKLNT